MTPQKKPFLFLIGSFLGFCVGYILTNSVEFRICIYEGLKRDPACLNFFERIGDPLFYGMGALSIVFLLLIFMPKAFPAWNKFAVWFVPLAAFLFIFYPDPGSGDLFSPYPETVFRWVSGAYVVISAAVILRASLKKA